jgi:hypothetical protein
MDDQIIGGPFVEAQIDKTKFGSGSTIEDTALMEFRYWEQ